MGRLERSGKFQANFSQFSPNLHDTRLQAHPHCTQNGFVFDRLDPSKLRAMRGLAGRTLGATAHTAGASARALRAAFVIPPFKP